MSNSNFYFASIHCLIFKMIYLTNYRVAIVNQLPHLQFYTFLAFTTVSFFFKCLKIISI